MGMVAAWGGLAGTARRWWKRLASCRLRHLRAPLVVLPSARLRAGVLDTTIVYVALDTLSRDLHSSLTSIEWVSSGYLLSLAAVIRCQAGLLKRSAPSGPRSCRSGCSRWGRVCARSRRAIGSRDGGPAHADARTRVRDMTVLSRKRPIDKLVEAYVDWREACVRVDDAYRACARKLARGAQSCSGCVWRRSTLRSWLPTPTPGWSAAPRSSSGPKSVDPSRSGSSPAAWTAHGRRAV